MVNSELTGIFSIGATRRAYLLTRQGDGKLDDFEDYVKFVWDGIFRLVSDFYELGGRHFIAPILWYNAFEDRGPRYGAMLQRYVEQLIDVDAIVRYRSFDADPLFLGLDMWRSLPDTRPERLIADRLQAFQDQWPHSASRRTLIWEIAGVPAYDLTRLGTRLLNQQPGTAAPPVLADDAYRQAALALYSGHPVDYPRFYVASHLSDRFMVRAPLSLALSGAAWCQFYFTPYPILLMPRAAMKHIIEDALNAEMMDEFDYRERLSPQEIAAMYEAMRSRIADPDSIFGLHRKSL